MIIQGLEQMHGVGYCHRDLKLQNLLLHQGILKLADFGFAKYSGSFDPVHRTKCGTPQFSAPEIRNREVLAYRAFPADIWSAGCVLFIMLKQTPPMKSAKVGDWWFDRLNEVPPNTKYFWMAHEQGDNPVVISDSAKRLIEGMLTVNPAERLTIAQIKRHPWYVNTDVYTPAEVRGVLQVLTRQLQDKIGGGSYDDGGGADDGADDDDDDTGGSSKEDEAEESSSAMDVTDMEKAIRPEDEFDPFLAGGVIRRSGSSSSSSADPPRSSFGRSHRSTATSGGLLNAPIVTRRHAEGDAALTTISVAASQQQVDKALVAVQQRLDAKRRGNGGGNILTMQFDDDDDDDAKTVVTFSVVTNAKSVVLRRLEGDPFAYMRIFGTLRSVLLADGSRPQRGDFGRAATFGMLLPPSVALRKAVAAEGEVAFSKR
eukprot:g952.t1